VKSANTKVGTLTLNGVNLILGAGALAGTDPDNPGNYEDTLKGNTLVATYFTAAGEPIIESGLTDGFEITSLLILEGAGSTNGALLKGTGKVVAGDAVIVGGTAGWQAVGTGSSVIGYNVIFGSAALTGQDASSAIGVTATAEITAPRLVVAAKIDLTTQGTVTLTGYNTGASNKASLLLVGSQLTGFQGSLKAVASGADMSIGDTSSTGVTLSDSGSGTAAVTLDDETPITATSVIVAKCGNSGDASGGTTFNELGGGTTEGAENVLVTSDADPANKLAIKSDTTITCSNT
jgi:hypothetical protein